MSDNTAMVPVNLDQLPSTQIGTDDQFAELAKGGDYIGRMQLYTKSKANMKGLIPHGPLRHPGVRRRDHRPGRHPWTCCRWPAGRRPST